MATKSGCQLRTPKMKSQDPLEWHRCSHCQRILLDVPIGELESLHSGAALPHTIAEAYEARRDGCPLFQLYPQRPFYDCSFIQSLRPSTWNPWLSYRPSLKSRVTKGVPRLFRTLWGRDYRPFSIAYLVDGFAYTLPFGCSVNLTRPMFVGCPEGDPASRDHMMRPMTSVTNSESVFRFLREQLDNCLNVHVPAGSCKFNATGHEAPRRLIHIIPHDDQLHLRLIEAPDNTALGWFALSYCWGASPTLATTRDTLQARLDGIHFGDLPQTLRDAVLVCHKLDVSYIWIDSLCIVQDDEEKARDIARMPNVYGNAYITLSASSASTVTEGFLAPRTINMPFTPFALRYLCKDGTEGTLVFQPMIIAGRDPVSLRGWTLQERVLSPRLVDFSNLQVLWRCQTVKRCASGPRRKSDNASDYLASTSLQRRDPKYTADLCKRLVEDYSQRRLTFPEDKLVAFSAIPTQLNRSGGYFAGLWAADFPLNLLWLPDSTPSKPVAARPKKYRAPSWS